MTIKLTVVLTVSLHSMIFSQGRVGKQGKQGTANALNCVVAEDMNVTVVMFDPHADHTLLL